MDLEDAIKKCRDDLPEHGRPHAHPKKHDEAVEAEEDGEDFLHEDVADALTLLSKALTMLNYISDPILCKAISNRERAGMNRLSTKIREFIDEVEGSYTEVEE